MMAKKVRPLLQRYRTIFMRRSYVAIKNMEHRFKGREIPFSIDELRGMISEAIKVGLCPLCNDKLTARNFSLDHRIPVSRGGDLTLLNLETVCMSCNRAKGDLTREEFLALVEVLRKMDERVMRSVLGRLKAGGAIAAGRRFL